ncbi:V-type ATPase subunit [Anaerococcus sp. AGMB00486]|uniref:V-type ATPase subunit n=2 Tax=Anaerococcus TaxID=165779 RepID=A0ABX2N761_9FIRM|nr:MULTISPECIES: V-type ATPase subunit [Anaerococcus]MDY3007167.1 V-type ATPase subunit [Anaerococcus porci]MSS76996.1 V-type ATPase subunit [Anaerococcus porci]NVF10515.1 V-type ATPase subunit [Anaerococcus faecalis]
MKSYVVKAKAKLGKLPDKTIRRDLLYEDDTDRKLDIIKSFYPEISSLTSKSDLEIGLENHLYDNLYSFLKFIKGEEKEFFIKYISRYEISILQLIIQALLNNHIKDSLEIIKENKFSKAFDIKEDYDFEDFVLKSNNTRYYRSLFPFLNENVDRSSLIFLSSNSLNKFYYRDLLEEISKFSKNERDELRDFIGKKIDIFNIEMLYRLIRFFDINSNEMFNYLIEGGKYLKSDDLIKLSNMNLINFKDFIIGSQYKDLFLTSKTFYKAKEDYLSKLSKKLANSKYDLLKLIYIVDMIDISNRNLISLLELDESFDKDEKKKYIIER